MKKVVLIFVTLLLLIPFNVNADKLYTKISGNKEVVPGANIVYTVVVDRPLTEYEAIIEYDRTVLNLINIQEISIDTSERTFETVKDAPVSVKVKGNTETSIIYAITFMAKNNISLTNTDISINTTTAKIGNDLLTFDKVDYRITFVEEDPLFVEEEITEDENDYLTKVVNSVGTLLNEYGSPITYVSVGLNILLFILLINSIRRKRVDYDF